MTTNITPRILVHGGAGQWKGFDTDAVLEGVRAAAAAGWAILKAGGTALDAVEASVVILEDHPLFDAGYGSFLNALGEVEMDALIADGRDVRFGAVAGVRHVKNAIKLARGVMEKTQNCFFVADGADDLAARLGMPLIANIELITEKEYQHFIARVKDAAPRTGLGTGTVGAVAVDASGHVASATSTGGTPDKPKGRVGDSPLFGAGGYADDAGGAASATGQGENIMRFFLSKDAVDRMRAGQPASEAVQAALTYLDSRIPNPDAGLIIVGADGRLGAAHSTPAMPIAWVDGDGEIGASMTMQGWL